MNNTKQRNKPSQPISQILAEGTPSEVRALFAFDRTSTDEEILFKLNLWGRFFYPKFYKAKDAPFHRDIDRHNLTIYRGTLKAGERTSFTDIAFRGAAKTTRTKLFVAFAIANDLDHRRRMIKVLSNDRANAVQIVTDVYNLLINRNLNTYYPEIFQKTAEKRQEAMSVFTTATGVKMYADTVGTEQRGDIQEDTRPDFVWFDDFETRKTLRSAVTTQAIWDNMEEAKNGLSKDGGAIYNCNYLSERGNVHRLVERAKQAPETSLLLITPIRIGRTPTWNLYTIEEIDNIERNADDFAGEYLCEPSAGADIMFDRALLAKQIPREPKRVIAGFKIFHEYDPSHRYASAHDVAGGVGLDSSTSVFIDFHTSPSRVVATYKNNLIKPDTFGDEIKNQADRYGECLVAPESNNHGHATIGRLKQIYDNIFFKEEKDTRAGIPSRTRYYGWQTNADTKPKMIFALLKAVHDGHLELSDPDLIAEARSYTRDDLMDKDEDVRLTTRHFDLLIAAAIAYQMKDFATVAREAQTYYQQPSYERPGLDE